MTLPFNLNSTSLSEKRIFAPALAAVPIEMRFAFREGRKRTFLNRPGHCLPSIVAVKSIVLDQGPEEELLLFLSLAMYLSQLTSLRRNRTLDLTCDE